MSPSTSYASTLAEADTIFIASHSQGSPVSVILIARLIREGLISPSRQRICILLMAGISHGPFPHLKSSFVVKHVEAESARQLFDFNDPGTAITRRYHAAISQVLNAGVRICAVASWYDQVVPLYSATLHAFNHPAIYRAIHIEGSDYTPDFLSHLVVFALRLRNAGLSDRGLLVYLSEFLAGNVYGFGTQGHSTVYEEVETYVLAVKWGLSEPVPYSYINIKKRLFENRNDDSSISNSGGEKINKPKCCNPYDPYDPYIASTSSKKLLVPLKAGVTDPRPPFEPHPENPISDLLITVDPTYHTKFSAPLSKLNGTWLPWIMAQLTSDPLVYANQDLRVHLDEVIRLFDEWEPNGKVPSTGLASSIMNRAAKGLSQGLQVLYKRASYSKEVIGQASDVTELPPAYKELEAFVRVTVNYTRKAYDYQAPLTDTALGYASSMQRGISSLIAKTGAVAEPQSPPHGGASGDDNKPLSLSHALAKAATAGLADRGVAMDEALGVSLKKFADTHNIVGDAHVKMKARRSVASVRLTYDAARAKLRTAKPEEEEKLRIEMETTEDEFVTAVDDAMAKMKLVIESPEPLKNLSDFVAAEL
ncbi:hypothetical protein HK100_011259, partial [Physocladia obscura]